MKIYNYSFIFTKPWDLIRDADIEKRVIATLEKNLGKTGGNFKRTWGPFRMSRPPEDFWREFYESAREWSGFEWMIRDFLSLPKSPLIVFYSGKDITNRIVENLGPTTPPENEDIITKAGTPTIRWIYGMPWNEGWKNVAHAPKPGEVERQIRIMWKYRVA
ncbi:MAG: nucleoside-diphosphate kinase [Nanoarchaeota archaeon]|nr:nucleoside-diphosphate kinase [Nanoarchaeota archaeon]